MKEIERKGEREGEEGRVEKEVAMAEEREKRGGKGKEERGINRIHKMRESA